jgi:DNA-binding CsgD family transcriptional regulator
MSPARIQRSHTKGWRAPAGAVYVGRGTRWGNPFVVGQTYAWLTSTEMPFPVPTSRQSGQHASGLRVEKCTKQETATTWFRAWMGFVVDLTPQAQAVLYGRDLMCWCPLPAEGQQDHCHAAVLLEVAGQSAATTAHDTVSQGTGPMAEPNRRQREILALAVDGRTDGQIAEYLSIKPATVHSALRSVCWVLDARDPAHAMATALARGVMHLDETAVPEHRFTSTHLNLGIDC